MLLYWSFAMKKVVGLVLGLVPVSAFAECVPVPDCASIGYTETSCDGDSVKCPFDTSKLKCIPCDSSFRFTCDGENIVSAVGEPCNNKYVTCNCVAGATFSNGECICDTSCSVGNIYYSDGTCSSCKIANKTPIGIVVNTNENLIIMGLEKENIRWSWNQIDDNGNITVKGRLDISGIPNYANSTDAITDFRGFENTQAIVATYGENATNVAGVFCYNYAPTGLENSKHNWYFPAAGESYNYMHKNLEKINTAFAILGKAKIADGIWTSSEISLHYAYAIKLSTGKVFQYGTKDDYADIYCLLKVN